MTIREPRNAAFAETGPVWASVAPFTEVFLWICLPWTVVPPPVVPPQLLVQPVEPPQLLVQGALGGAMMWTETLSLLDSTLPLVAFARSTMYLSTKLGLLGISIENVTCSSVPFGSLGVVFVALSWVTNAFRALLDPSPTR